MRIDTSSRLHCFFLSVFLLPAVFFSPPALAQLKKDFSEPEKAVFSFFKLAKQTPDYRRWINNTGLLNGTPQDLREEIYEQESLRLRWGFGTYDPSADALKIVADIYLQMKIESDGPALYFKFLDSGTEEIPFFPYPYGDQAIALVANDLAAFTAIPLSKDDHEKIAAHFRPSDIYPGRITLRIRPTKVDSSAPLALGGIDHWLMTGDTGYIAFHYTPPGSDKEITLWEYTAPWYLSQTEQLLLPLLNEGK